MVKEAKLQAVEDLKKKIDEAGVVGMLEMHKLPSKQYQEISKKLRGDAEFLMIKKSVLLNALEKSRKENIKKVAEKMPDQPALVFTKLDPFKFYMRAAKLKSPNYAKAGDVAEEEIEISPGPTDLMPGPVISEFSKVGIPAGVENGKIAIKRGKVVAKAGDIISNDLAGILRKLKIQPIKVGLNIVSVYDDGTIYTQDVLSLAGQGYIDRALLAHQHAVNLSVNVGYPTRENIGMLLARAQRESQALESKVKVPEAAQEKTVEKPEEKKEEKQGEQKLGEKTETPKSEESQPKDEQGGKE